MNLRKNFHKAEIKLTIPNDNETGVDTEVFMPLPEFIALIKNELAAVDIINQDDYED